MKKVREVMFKDVMTVMRSTTLKEILTKFMKFHTYPLVPVLETDNKLIGLISTDSLIDLLKPKEPPIMKTIPFIEEQPVDLDSAIETPEMGHLIVAEDIMETTTLTVEDDMPIDEALNLMRRHRKNHLAVTDKDHNFLGVIGIFDIVITIFKDWGII